jgi:hypothetical protein
MRILHPACDYPLRLFGKLKSEGRSISVTTDCECRSCTRSKYVVLSFWICLGEFRFLKRCGKSVVECLRCFILGASVCDLDFRVSSVRC